MEDVKLFGLSSSPFTQRVIWALKLKGVSYEYIPEDIFNKSNLLLQYNPIDKKVPVLVHNGNPVSESMIILEYIDETWPENPLLPLNAHERSLVRFWSKFIDEGTRHFVNFFRFTGDLQEKAMEENLETWRSIEQHSGLGEKKFFGGNTIGLADLALGWIAHTLVAMEEVFGTKFITADNFPNLHTWIGHFTEIPIIKDNLPPHELEVNYFKETREMFVAMESHARHHHSQ